MMQPLDNSQVNFLAYASCLDFFESTRHWFQASPVPHMLIPTVGEDCAFWTGPHPHSSPPQSSACLSLTQGLADLLCEGPQYVMVCRPYSLCETTQSERGHKQYVNEWLCLCTNQPCLWIVKFKFHSFNSFSNLLKMWILFLAHGPYKNRQEG